MIFSIFAVCPLLVLSMIPLTFPSWFSPFFCFCFVMISGFLHPSLIQFTFCKRYFDSSDICILSMNTLFIRITCHISIRIRIAGIISMSFTSLSDHRSSSSSSSFTSSSSLSGKVGGLPVGGSSLPE